MLLEGGETSSKEPPPTLFFLHKSAAPVLRNAANAAALEDVKREKNVERAGVCGMSRDDAYEIK
jgi:hypothetical protein